MRWRRYSVLSIFLNTCGCLFKVTLLRCPKVVSAWSAYNFWPRRFLTLAVSSTGRARDVTRDFGRQNCLSRHFCCVAELPREFASFPEQKINRSNRSYFGLFGALKKIRTPDLLVRSQTLYPAELSAQKYKRY